MSSAGSIFSMQSNKLCTTISMPIIYNVSSNLGNNNNENFYASHDATCLQSQDAI